MSQILSAVREAFYAYVAWAIMAACPTVFLFAESPQVQMVGYVGTSACALLYGGGAIADTRKAMARLAQEARQTRTGPPGGQTIGGEPKTTDRHRLWVTANARQSGGRRS